MTLRLSTPSTASGSASSGIDVYMQRLLDDTSISLSQKNDCVSYKKSSLYLKRLVQELATLLCSALLCRCCCRCHCRTSNSNSFCFVYTPSVNSNSNAKSPADCQYFPSLLSASPPAPHTHTHTPYNLISTPILSSSISCIILRSVLSFLPLISILI